MIARRGRDDAALSLLLTELGDEIDAATYLEGSDWLIVLMLAGVYTYHISLFS